MSIPIHIDLDDDEGHLVEAPMVDMVVHHPGREEWSITFVPDPTLSSREKETVLVRRGTSDFKRIDLQMQRVAEKLGHPVERLVHSGGGDFRFFLNDGSAISLSDESGSSALTMEIYIALKDIAMTAQLAKLAAPV